MALGNGMRWGGRVVAAQLLLKAMLSGGPMKIPEQKLPFIHESTAFWNDNGTGL